MANAILLSNDCLLHITGLEYEFCTPSRAADHEFDAKEGMWRFKQHTEMEKAFFHKKGQIYKINNY